VTGIKLWSKFTRGVKMGEEVFRQLLEEANNDVSIAGSLSNFLCFASILIVWDGIE
jgi:hypothetical protein